MMQDFFLINQNVIDRLIREWKAYGRIIIAYDFDNTVFDYHQEGHTFHQVIELLQKCKELGAYFIVFTSCAESKFPFLKEYLMKNNIPFDSINEDAPFITFGGRKPYYNHFLDDRAGLASAYYCLNEAVKIMESENISA